MKTKEVEEYIEALGAIRLARKLGVTSGITRGLHMKAQRAWVALSEEEMEGWKKSKTHQIATK